MQGPAERARSAGKLFAEMKHAGLEPNVITYSGTMYPLVALYKCNKLPKTDSGGD